MPTNPATPRPSLQEGARVLHTMLRVANLERALAFYVDTLGMTLFRREEYPGGRFTLAFVGYGMEGRGASIELTWNWDLQSYDLGSAYGHIALGVPDVHVACSRLVGAGIRILRPAGPMTHISPQCSVPETIAFIEDPDGYRIELIAITP